MAETWRECPFGGEPYAIGRAGEGGTPMRMCSCCSPAPIEYGPHGKGRAKAVRQCAKCPVPAQLDALEKARAHCGWLLSEYPEGGKPADIVESTQVVYEACTAALEQAKGEEHDG